MSKKQMIRFINMDLEYVEDLIDTFRIKGSGVEFKMWIKNLQKEIKLALLEQDRDTRHACASEMIEHKNHCYDRRKEFDHDIAHEICMNCQEGTKDVSDTPFLDTLDKNGF